MATCVYARQYILSSSSQSRWYIHLRADASPKGGRDFFVCEYDWCQLGVSLPYASNMTVEQLLQEGRFAIQSRILPLAIVGSRAASAVHKGKLLLKSLSMESEDLKCTVRRTRSLLFDFGAEAGLWTLQDFLQEEKRDQGEADDASASFSRLFSHALPIADVDHGLHHIMEEIPSAFSGWRLFKDTLSAFARAFGKYYRLERFRDVCIGMNSSVPEHYKGQLRALFRQLCPPFVDHRWEYLYETLAWVLPRKQAFMYLRLDDFTSSASSRNPEDDDDSLTVQQMQLLANLSEDCLESAEFWAIAELCQSLAAWGHWFSGVSHGCPCHSLAERRESTTFSCAMTGRTGVLLACGLPQVALTKLDDARSHLPSSARAAINSLRSFDSDDGKGFAIARRLLDEYNVAISKLKFRTTQSFGYWGQLPWSLLMVMRPFVERFDDTASVT